MLSRNAGPGVFHGKLGAAVGHTAEPNLNAAAGWRVPNSIAHQIAGGTEYFASRAQQLSLQQAFKTQGLREFRHIASAVQQLATLLLELNHEFGGANVFGEVWRRTAFEIGERQ